MQAPRLGGHPLMRRWPRAAAIALAGLLLASATTTVVGAESDASSFPRADDRAGLGPFQALVELLFAWDDEPEDFTGMLVDSLIGSGHSGLDIINMHWGVVSLDRRELRGIRRGVRADDESQTFGNLLDLVPEGTGNRERQDYLVVSIQTFAQVPDPADGELYAFNLAIDPDGRAENNAAVTVGSIDPRQGHRMFLEVGYFPDAARVQTDYAQPPRADTGDKRGNVAPDFWAAISEDLTTFVVPAETITADAGFNVYTVFSDTDGSVAVDTADPPGGSTASFPVDGLTDPTIVAASLTYGLPEAELAPGYLMATIQTEGRQDELLGSVQVRPQASAGEALGEALPVDEAVFESGGGAWYQVVAPEVPDGRYVLTFDQGSEQLTPGALKELDRLGVSGAIAVGDLDGHLAGSPDLVPGSGPATSPPASRIPGDYDGDGVVDASDYVVWRKTLGQTAASDGTLDADGDGNGVVDDGDYAVWQANFGRTS